MITGLHTIIQELNKLGDENTINSIFSDENIKKQREEIFNFLKIKYNGRCACNGLT